MDRRKFLKMAMATPIGAMLTRWGKTETIPGKDETARTASDIPALLRVDPMEIQMGLGLIHLVDDLLDRISAMRRQIALDLGIVVPPIRIRDNTQLAYNGYVILIKGNHVAEGELLPDRHLALNPGDVKGPVNGIKIEEPAFGLLAYWVDSPRHAEALGYTVVDAPSVLSTHLAEVVKKNAHELLTREATVSLLESLHERAPHLIGEMVSSLPSVREVQEVLQLLLKERVSIRDLETIVEALANHAHRTQDPELLAEYVRQALARQICQQVQDEDGVIHAVALDSALEQYLIKSVEHCDTGSYLDLLPEEVRSIVEAIHKEAERLVALGHEPVILCAPQVRRHVKRITDNQGMDLTVLSYSELVREAKVQIP
jgi:flagellar biosynthesis protein FlhA